MNIADYLQYWPQIQAAFSSVGSSLTLEQVIQLIPLIETIISKATPATPPPTTIQPIQPIEPAPTGPKPWILTVEVLGMNNIPLVSATGQFQPDLPAGSPFIVGVNTAGYLSFAVPAQSLDSWGGNLSVSAPGYNSYSGRIQQPDENQPTITLTPTAVIIPSLPQVQFDHVWTGNVESKMQSILSTGLAGVDGSNGQAVIDKLNAMSGIYAGGEFQAHHDGPTGLPTYGFNWFYVSYLPNQVYQIVQFGTAPAGD